MDSKIKYCSIYKEVKTTSFHFLQRNQVAINWVEFLDVSKKCGMIKTLDMYVNENEHYRITYWDHADSYTQWLSQPIVQNYITIRDDYNQQNNIVTSLSFGKIVSYAN